MTNQSINVRIPSQKISQIMLLSQNDNSKMSMSQLQRHEKVTKIVYQSEIVEEDDEMDQQLQIILQRHQRLQQDLSNRKNAWPTVGSDGAINRHCKDKLVSLYSPEVHSYLKAKFIFEQLLYPIQKMKLFNLDDIYVVEFIYLISFRAWMQINLAQQNSEVQKQGLGEVDQKHLKVLRDLMSSIGDKVYKIFTIFHYALTQNEKYFWNKIVHLSMSVFKRGDKHNRDIYTCGVEGLDFSRAQQIKYTVTKYIPVIEQMAAKENPESTRCDQMIPKLRAYEDILSISLESMEGFDDFHRRKQDIISKCLNSCQPPGRQIDVEMQTKNHCD